MDVPRRSPGESRARADQRNRIDTSSRVGEESTQRHAEGALRFEVGRRDVRMLHRRSGLQRLAEGSADTSRRRLTLRELRISDAAPLCALLTVEEATRFISAPPATVDGFERFIGWTLRQRIAGTSVCYAITVPGFDTAIGIIQVRQLDPDFSTAEWGFVIGTAFWGTGVFQQSAELVLAFTFQTLRVNRLEARAAVLNGRGNGALMKIGAVQEGILRQSFFKSGKFLDQALYSILPTDARLAGGIGVSGHPRVH